MFYPWSIQMAPGPVSTSYLTAIWSHPLKLGKSFAWQSGFRWPYRDHWICPHPQQLLDKFSTLPINKNSLHASQLVVTPELIMQADRRAQWISKPQNLSKRWLCPVEEADDCVCMGRDRGSGRLHASHIQWHRQSIVRLLRFISQFRERDLKNCK